MTGQIYVEKLEPLHVRHEHPLVFITGNVQTGTVSLFKPAGLPPSPPIRFVDCPQNWLNTPDDRPGWASYFLKRGYTIYLTDQAQRGRSPWLPGDGQLSLYSVETYEKQFTAPQNSPSYPQAALHTQWPGPTGLLGDPVFDALYASQVPSQNNATLQATYNNASYVALLDKIGPAIVIAHSQGGPFAWKLADVRPQLVKGIVALEPEGPPFENYAAAPFDPAYIRPAANRNRPFGLTLLPIAYDPPIGLDASLMVRENASAPNANLSSCIRQAEPARRLVNLAEVPVLFVTAEASYHAVYDHCTVAYLRQAGVHVEYLELGEAGIHGNGHFMFLELNNLQVAERVSGWLGRFVGG
jgi:pimeloyl-ACP methyl ester carboxylesterase